MAQNQNFNVDATAYTPLTNSDVTAARVQNTSGVAVWLQANSSSTLPSSDVGAILLSPYAGIDASLTLAQLFPGVTGAVRLFAKSASAGTGAMVSVSHA